MPKSSVPPLAERKRPGLSQTLEGERRPDRCQNCGADTDLIRWRECDEWDQPTEVLVHLCGPCSTRLIDPHPRLYQRVELFRPWPGAMPLCVDCTHRDGLRCRNPNLAKNGGPGLVISYPKPTRAHLYYGRGRGEWVDMYPGPPMDCAGREGA